MKKPNFAAMNPVVAEAIQQIMAEQGDKFSLEEINLADLGRRTGISRAKLRRMKEHDFEDVQHALKGRKATTTLLSGYTGILDGLLKAGIVNSVVCLDIVVDELLSGPHPGVRVFFKLPDCNRPEEN